MRFGKVSASAAPFWGAVAPTPFAVFVAAEPVTKLASSATLILFGASTAGGGLGSTVCGFISAAPVVVTFIFASANVIATAKHRGHRSVVAVSFLTMLLYVRVIF